MQRLPGSDSSNNLIIAFVFSLSLQAQYKLQYSQLSRTRILLLFPLTPLHPSTIIIILRRPTRATEWRFGVPEPSSLGPVATNHHIVPINSQRMQIPSNIINRWQLRNDDWKYSQAGHNGNYDEKKKDPADNNNK